MTDEELDSLKPGDFIYSKASGKKREVVMLRKSGTKVIAIELLAVSQTRYGCSTAAVERWSLKNRYERNKNE
jgi:hypothetical protein